jgi:hypothetical protein
MQKCRFCSRKCDDGVCPKHRWLAMLQACGHNHGDPDVERMRLGL